MGIPDSGKQFNLSEGERRLVLPSEGVFCFEPWFVLSMEVRQWPPLRKCGMKKLKGTHTVFEEADDDELATYLAAPFDQPAFLVG